MKTTVLRHLSAEEFRRIAFKVSLVSIIGNAALTVFKLLVGLFAHSGAMVGDAVHSASDIFSSIVVIIGVKLAARASDKEHPYGHERFECVAAILLAIILFVSGLFIGHVAIENIKAGNHANAVVPGAIALVAAVISIASKEAMYWYTRYHAKRTDSGALMADAWHHRSDALSSVGAFFGILGARMGYPILDAVASLVIALFIAKAAYDIFKDAINKMVDRSCPTDTEVAITACATAVDGVKGIDLLRTRVFGNKIYVDLEICADASLTLRKGHEIAAEVHDAIEARFPEIKHIMVHVNPFEEESSP